MPARATVAREKQRPADAKRRKPRHGAADPITTARLAFASEALAKSGMLSGARTKKVSARVDPGLIEAARTRTGIANDSDLIAAALAIVAAQDDFGPWLVAQAGRLPADFELDF